MTGADAFQARVAQVNAELEEAVRTTKRAEREMREDPRFQQRLREVEEYARSRAAPRALRDLQRRIDNGELSWNAIADGKHLDDPSVRAALAADISEPVPVDDDDEPRRGYAFTRFDPDADN